MNGPPALKVLVFLIGMFGCFLLVLDNPTPINYTQEKVETRITVNIEKSNKLNTTPAASDNYTFANAKKILFYSTFYGQGHRWNMGRGREPFVKAKCPVSNCYLTDDHTLLDNVADYDALIFMMRSINLLDDKNKLLIPDPKNRTRSQRYILYVWEPTWVSVLPFKRSDINEAFNWTITYKLDSDIPHPYGWMESLARGPEDLNKFPAVYHPKWVKYDKSAVLKEIRSNATFRAMADRPKGISWVTSHCNTQSRREVYVESLKEHIDVDIFGRCSGVSCGSGPVCAEFLKENYKFYLAFEQSLCQDYVSEKFWNALSWDLVPIVMGGLDYSKFAPPHSYIDIKDFEKPEHLAEYLKFLMENPEEYLTYFWWKDHYVARRGFDNNRNTWCELCRRLNNPDEPESVFRNFDNFKRCENPTWAEATRTKDWDAAYKKSTLFTKTVKPIARKA